jgi:hypothetical protein
MYACFSKNNAPKRRFLNSQVAIDAAKWANENYPIEFTKQVAYKCGHCQGYHLTTQYKKVKK